MNRTRWFGSLLLSCLLVSLAGAATVTIINGNVVRLDSPSPSTLSSAGNARIRYNPDAGIEASVGGGAFGALASDSTKVPLAGGTMTGQLVNTLNPASTGITDSTILANPAACGANEVLMGVAVAGSRKAGLDCEGDADARNLTLSGFQAMTEIAAPAVSAAGAATLYPDSTSHTWKVSNNNGAYTDILTGTGTGVTGSGTSKQVTYWSGTNTIAGNSGFQWDTSIGQLLFQPSTFTSTVLVNFGLGGPVTPSVSVVAEELDLTSMSGVNALNATGLKVDIPGTTRAGTGTEVYTGIVVAPGTAYTQNTGAGTIDYRGVSSTLVVATQTTGTVTEDAFRATIPSSAIVTGGVINGFNIPTITTGPAAGTLTGLNIGNITTPGAGTETAINVGTGWDTGATFASPVSVSSTITATGQILGTLDPAGTGITSSTILANPTTCASNEVLVGSAVNGTRKSGFDCEGDIDGRNLTLAGSISGATTIAASSTIAGSGQIRGLLDPADTSFASGSIIANPIACGANEILLGAGVLGTGLATFDCEGDAVVVKLNTSGAVVNTSTMDQQGTISNTTSNACTNGTTGDVCIQDGLSVNGAIRGSGALTVVTSIAANSVGASVITASGDPVDTSFSSGALIANPATCGANEILLGAGVNGTGKATFDCEGDAIVTKLNTSGAVVNTSTMDQQGALSNTSSTACTNGATGDVCIQDAVTVNGTLNVATSIANASSATCGALNAGDLCIADNVTMSTGGNAIITMKNGTTSNVSGISLYNSSGTFIGQYVYAGSAGADADYADRVDDILIGKVRNFARTDDVGAGSFAWLFTDDTAASSTLAGPVNFAIDGSGAVKFRPMTSTNGATCNSTNEGMWYYRSIAASNKSGYCTCAQTSSGVFAWKSALTFGSSALVDGDC